MKLNKNHKIFLIFSPYLKKKGAINAVIFTLNNNSTLKNFYLRLLQNFSLQKILSKNIKLFQSIYLNDIILNNN